MKMSHMYRRYEHETGYRNSRGNDTYNHDRIQPYFGGFQLIGDSLFVRFAGHILNQRNQLVNGVRTIGLCVSGQRIDQLRHKIKSNFYPLTSNVMVLIGTNDVLCGGDLETMIKHFNRLLKLLRKTVNYLVILTLPPIPKLCVTYHHWTLIRQYNAYLKGFDNGTTIRVADICPLFTKFREALEFRLSSPVPVRGTLSLDRRLIIETEPSSDYQDELRRYQIQSKLHRMREMTETRQIIKPRRCKKTKENHHIKYSDVLAAESDYAKSSEIILCRESEVNMSSELSQDIEIMDAQIIKKGAKRKLSQECILLQSDDDIDILTITPPPSVKKQKVELETLDTSNDATPKTSRKKTKTEKNDGGKPISRIFSLAIGDIKPGKNDKTWKKNKTKNDATKEIKPEPPKTPKPEQKPKKREAKVEKEPKEFEEAEESEEPEVQFTVSINDVETPCSQENFVSTDSWLVESDDESMEEFVYLSKEEISCDIVEVKNERNEPGNSDFSRRNDAGDSDSSEVTNDEDQGHKKQINPSVDFNFVEFFDAIEKEKFHRESIKTNSRLYETSSAVRRDERRSRPSRSPPDRSDDADSHLIDDAGNPPPPESRNYDSNTPRRFSDKGGNISLEGISSRDRQIIERSREICHLENYEVFYSRGNKRIDMIHLNYRGLKKVREFLIENGYVYGF